MNHIFIRNKHLSVIKNSTIPVVLQPWLFASGSLTKQLTDLAGGQFKVEPIKQYFKRLSFHDAQWMKFPHQHTAWVRDAYLYGCDKQAWVRAKSIFPILSLQKRARIFQYLGTRPIGFFLFQRTYPLCERRIILLDDGWTRQSCYTWHGCKFIVQETFLPQFEKFLELQHS